MAKNDSKTNLLWNGISDADFINEKNIVDEDIASYNLEKMTIFSANINYMRQLLKVSDSLKPVERRSLYVMYSHLHLTPKNETKSVIVVGATMRFHNHGDSSIYNSIVGMNAYWKKAVPLIKSESSMGNPSDETYAHMRYTEVTISDYAYECFFEDFDPDCVEMIQSTSANEPEPLSLPSKFPNILVNGGTGMAIGNAFYIPPYTIPDIVDCCQKLIKNPDRVDLFCVPSVPTGCLIVNSNDNLKEIFDTGKGILKMRSDIEICDEWINSNRSKKHVWVLKVKNIPWYVNMQSVITKITELTKKGILPILDTQNHSYQYKNTNGSVRTQIDYRIIIDYSQDPYQVRKKLYKLTEMEKTVGVNFKVVLDGLSVENLNFKQLLLTWIDERREYKRRELNKKIAKINTRIALLDLLIELLQENKIEKTIQIVRNSTTSEIVEALRKQAKMTSFQANKIAEMRLGAFTKDARERYITERAKLDKELEKIMDLVKSEKKIDKIIIEELDDLRKYDNGVRCQVVEDDENIHISNNDYTIITTKQGYIKKLLYSKENSAQNTNYGAFKAFDYPTNRLVINNLDNMILFDTLGRYSIVPVHQIDTCDLASTGNRLFDIAKLNGEVISIFHEFNDESIDFIHNKLHDEIAVVSLTKNGYLKKTDLHEFMKLKNTKNIRAMKIRNDDQLVFSGTILDSAHVVIYTKKGYFSYVTMKDVQLQGKDTMGLKSIPLDDDDECVGLSVIDEKDDFVVIVTEKGIMKKCEIAYLGEPGSRRSAASYLITLDNNDNVKYVGGMRSDNSVSVVTGKDIHDIPADMIPTLTRKAKGAKKVPVPVGVNIIAVSVK